MDRYSARMLARKMTNKQIHEMLVKVRCNTIEWNQSSILDRRVSKGVMWNRIAKDFDETKRYEPFEITNLVREFGDHIEIKTEINNRHEEPIFKESGTI